jgi:hypothetical protein
MTTIPFELFLFSTQPQIIKEAIAAGVDGIIVDWENAGKKARQSGYDTQINQATVEDLTTVRRVTSARVICRINGYNPETVQQVEKAINAGADEILLPMVRSGEEVARTLDFIQNRCTLGILVETLAATKSAAQFNQFPLSRIYVGLNDLAIDRKVHNIFQSLADGLVEQVRNVIQLPFGFGGLTLPELGSPIPCRYLIAEMVRLCCNFTFLRRSFLRDIQGKSMAVEIPLIRSALAEMTSRPAAQVQTDKAALDRIIQNMPPAVLQESV